MRYPFHLAVTLILCGSSVCWGQESTSPEPPESPKVPAAEVPQAAPLPLPNSPATVDPQDPILQEIMRQLKSQPGLSLAPESVVIGAERSTPPEANEIDDETWSVAEEMLRTARRMLKHSERLHKSGQLKQAERLAKSARHLRQEVKAMLSDQAANPQAGAVDTTSGKPLENAPSPPIDDFPSPSDQTPGSSLLDGFR